MPSVLAKTAVDMSPLALFLAADIVVKLVMLGLIAASVWSWAIILERSRRLAAINAQAKAFEEWFWKADSLDQLYDPAAKATHPSAKLFVAGMNEWRRSLARQGSGGTIDREGVRARLTSLLGVAIAREMDDLGDRLNVLATIGAVAPFVGLFGTVWGIMRAFGRDRRVAEHVIGRRRAGHR